MEIWLAQRFGDSAGDADFPFAAVALRGETIAEPAETYWLRADPVHLSVNRDRVVLMDASQLAITDAESTALIASMGEHFKSDGLNFFAAHPQRWYLRSNNPILLHTQPVSAVRGRSVTQHWFDGDDRKLWQTRLSEMQMLLHAHPINEARETAGELPINGVWFWGEGKPPSGLKKPYAHIVASDPLLAGCALLASARYTDMNQFRWSDVSQIEADNVLIVVDQLATLAAYAEWDAWQSALAALDHAWFGPGLSALKNGQIKTLRIYVPSKERSKKLTTTRTDLFKFWRRSK